MITPNSRILIGLDIADPLCPTKLIGVNCDVSLAGGGEHTSGAFPLGSSLDNLSGQPASLAPVIMDPP